MELDVVLFNVTLKGAPHAEGIEIKVEDELGGVGLPHKEYVNNGRENLWVNGRRAGKKNSSGTHI